MHLGRSEVAHSCMHMSTGVCKDGFAHVCGHARGSVRGGVCAWMRCTCLRMDVCGYGCTRVFACTEACMFICARMELHTFVHRDLCGHKCANTSVSVQGGVCAFVQGLHKCVHACRCMCTWIYVAMGLHVRVHLDACKVCVWLCAHGCVPGCESVWGWCGVAHACAHAQICARMRRKCTGRGLHMCVPAHLLAHPRVYTWMRVHVCARLCNEYGCPRVCTCTWRHMHMCLCHDRLHTCVCVQPQALGSVQGCACTHVQCREPPMGVPWCWVLLGGTGLAPTVHAGCIARPLRGPRCTDVAVQSAVALLARVRDALHGPCTVHFAPSCSCMVHFIAFAQAQCSAWPLHSAYCIKVPVNIALDRPCLCTMHCIARASCILHQANVLFLGCTLHQGSHAWHIALRVYVHNVLHCLCLAHCFFGAHVLCVAWPAHGADLH